MKKFIHGFLLGFSALFVFFPFGSNIQDTEDGIASSWKNVGFYLRKAMNNYGK